MLRVFDICLKTARCTCDRVTLIRQRHQYRIIPVIQRALSTDNPVPDTGNNELEQRVIEFFNTCDYVTLKKLTNLKWSFFRNFEPHSVMQHGRRGKRFEQIDEVIEHTGFKEDQFPALDELITKLRKADMARLDIKKLRPEFKMSVANLKGIERVAVIDLYQRQYNWVVQDVSSREFISTGNIKLFDDSFKFTYDHVEHHQELSLALNQVPESQIYLVCSYGKKKPVTGSKMVKFEIHQNIMEAILITLLINRQSMLKTCGEMDKTDENRDADDLEHLDNRDETDKSEITNSMSKSDSKPFKLTTGNELPAHPSNHVYLFDSRTLAQFYNISIQGEPLHCGQYIQKWYQQNDGPLEGLVLPRNILEALSEQDQLSKCILMADIFCRSVAKFDKEFPMAYS